MGFCHASILILCSQNLLIISFFSTPGVWIIVTKFSPALKCRRILSIFSRPCTVLLFQLIPNLCGIYSSVCWKISVKLIFFQMADRLSQKYLLNLHLCFSDWDATFIICYTFLCVVSISGLSLFCLFFSQWSVYSCTYITPFSLGRLYSRF